MAAASLQRRVHRPMHLLVYDGFEETTAMTPFTAWRHRRRPSPDYVALASCLWGHDPQGLAFHEECGKNLNATMSPTLSMQEHN